MKLFTGEDETQTATGDFIMEPYTPGSEKDDEKTCFTLLSTKDPCFQITSNEDPCFLLTNTGGVDDRDDLESPPEDLMSDFRGSIRDVCYFYDGVFAGVFMLYYGSIEVDGDENLYLIRFDCVVYRGRLKKILGINGTKIIMQENLGPYIMQQYGDKLHIRNAEYSGEIDKIIEVDPRFITADTTVSGYGEYNNGWLFEDDYVVSTEIHDTEYFEDISVPVRYWTHFRLEPWNTATDFKNIYDNCYHSSDWLRTNTDAIKVSCRDCLGIDQDGTCFQPLPTTFVPASYCNLYSGSQVHANVLTKAFIQYDTTDDYDRVFGKYGDYVVSKLGIMYVDGIEPTDILVDPRSPEGNSEYLWFCSNTYYARDYSSNDFLLRFDAALPDSATASKSNVRYNGDYMIIPNYYKKSVYFVDLEKFKMKYVQSSTCVDVYDLDKSGDVFIKCSYRGEFPENYPAIELLRIVDEIVFD